MTKRTIIKASMWAVSILLVLTVALAVHIYVVTRPKMEDKRVRQMSRIDFIQKPDSLEASKIKGFVLQLKGVDAVYFNVPDGALVYSYNPSEQNSVQVYNQLMASGAYKAKRFIVNAEDLVKGCPVLDKSSFSYRLGAFFERLFS